MEGNEIGQRRHGGGGGHDQNDRLVAMLDVGPVAVEPVIGDGRGDRRDLLAQQAVLPRHLLGEGAGLDDGIEADHHVDPVVVRGQRHLGFDDDAVGAVGVRDLEDVRTGQIEHARLGLAGDDLEPEDVAEGRRPPQRIEPTPPEPPAMKPPSEAMR